MLERKLFFGVEDIKGLCLECLGCSARVHLPLEKLQSLPQACPVCFADWMPPPTSQMSSSSPYGSFAFSLRRLREIVKQGSGMAFRVLLEFEEPK